MANIKILIKLREYIYEKQEYLYTSSCVSNDGLVSVGLVKLATMAATEGWRDPSGNRQLSCEEFKLLHK